MIGKSSVTVAISPTKKGHRTNSPGWFITFGDLLTLILCFFLSLVSLGVFGGKSEAVVRDSMTETKSGSDSSDSSGQRDIGTALAIFSGQERHVERELLILREEDFLGDAANVPHETLTELKMKVFNDSYREGGVRIEGCLPALEEDLAGSWHASMSRVLSLRSQIIDAGVPGSLLAVRAMGGYCVGINGEGVARIIGVCGVGAGVSEGHCGSR